MKPKRINIILKIIAFLVLCLGILYICQYFVKNLKEGFASSPALSAEALTNISTANCTHIRDADRNIILCPNSNAANLIFQKIDINLPGEYDNVCITSTEFSSNYYTCYTKPAPPVYNDKYGIYRKFDPIVDDDTMASDLVPSIDTFCASYARNTVNVIKNIKSTQSLYNVLVSTKTNIDSSKFIVNNLIFENCRPGNTTATACSNLSNMYTYMTDSSSFGGDLNNVISAVKESIDSLSNTSTTTYNMYNGSKCNNLLAYNLKDI
jgi:hypothetical protein